jgi:hypothetical protein
VCPRPHRSKLIFIAETALTALADKYALQFMNEGLIKKSKEGRQNKSKKHFGIARVRNARDTQDEGRQGGKGTTGDTGEGESCCSRGQDKLYKEGLEGIVSNGHTISAKRWPDTTKTLY